MRKLVFISLFILPFFIYGQNTPYEVNSFLNKGVKAPNIHHIGEAWLNLLVEADDDFDMNITQATFKANSTLDWHKHSTPQVIIVIEGEGYYQEMGEEPIIIKKGDVIKCPKDVEHWHTSSANQMVSYIAVYGDEPTIWTDKLTREYYNSVAKKLEEDQ